MNIGAENGIGKMSLNSKRSCLSSLWTNPLEKDMDHFLTTASYQQGLESNDCIPKKEEVPVV